MLNAEATVLEKGNAPEDERSLLLKRIAASAPFRASARLREFLLYIGDCAIRETPAEATEQQIGLHIFRRPPGYNSSEDSIVRTHARLLRQKLALYFLEEGLHEPIIVEVPKGHYLPVFKKRMEVATAPTVEAPHLALPSLVEIPPAIVPSKTPAARSGWKLAFLALLLCVLATPIPFLLARWMHRAAPPTAVEQFWKPFLTGAPPLVVFSNALFTGDAKNGLSYAPQPDDPAKAGSNLVDTYTGIGELTAIYTLTQLFDAHHAHFILKRSRLMTWDDAKVRNVIFIGSTAENSSLKALQSSLDFSIIASPESAGIVNHHPKPGEPLLYSRPERPLTRDYAILALLPGMLSGESILVFSGLTTYGTQAGVEFVCRPESTAELLRQISGPKGELRPFEAVIETTITGGVPLQARVVTVHVH